MIIYLITNTVAGKHYVGQTTRGFDVRVKQHKKELRLGIHHNTYLQRHWIKYGESSFTFTAVARARHQLELDQLENIYLDMYESMTPNGYNLKTGGQRQNSYSESSRKKMSEKRKGFKHSEETKEKIRIRVRDNYGNSIRRQEILDKVKATRKVKPKKIRVKTYKKTDEEKQHTLMKKRMNAKGYSYCKHRDKWIAKVVVDGKKKHLGYYHTPDEAAEAYHRYVATLIKQNKEYSFIKKTPFTPNHTFFFTQ